MPSKYSDSILPYGIFVNFRTHSLGSIYKEMPG